MVDTGPEDSNQSLNDQVIQLFANSGLAQKAFCAGVLDHKISQPTLSRILRDPNYTLRGATARALRRRLEQLERAQSSRREAPNETSKQGDAAPFVEPPTPSVDPLGRRADLIDAGIKALERGATPADLGLFVSLANELDVDNRAAAAALADLVRTPDASRSTAGSRSDPEAQV